MYIKMKARAKINLFLEIVGSRDDGYYNLRSIMQTVYLHDQLTILKTDRDQLKLSCNSAYLPVDEHNLVSKAARYMKKTYGLPGGMSIYLRKNIPVSAGLAGGSSDCAAAILGIDRLYGLRLPRNELMDAGARFGADVPFCLLGGTALAEGKGEALTPLPPHPPATVVVAKPPLPMSTAAVFKAYDTAKHARGKNMRIILAGLEKKDIKGIASGFYNALEDVSVGLCPDIARLKKLYREQGALGALMSGSGTSVFAYFGDQRQAWRAMKKTSLAMPHVKQFLTGTWNDPKRSF